MRCELGAKHFPNKVRETSDIRRLCLYEPRSKLQAPGSHLIPIILPQKGHPWTPQKISFP